MRNGITRKRNFRAIFIGLSIIAGFLIISLTSICVPLHDSVKEFFEENHRVIGILLWLFGIGATMQCYSEYLERKQHDAVFGFYVNFRIYLERLNRFLGQTFDKASVLSRMYTESANISNARDNPSDEMVSSYAQLSKDFLTFLSISKDNVPPVKGEQKFVDWFNNQMVLVKFLQEGVSSSNSSFGWYSSRDDLVGDYNAVKKAIKDMLEDIESRITKDSRNS